ncbi:Transmembrane 9 superfamily member [Caenorhabditis elegans]|uniref:Transmembrane 9 superfamily member n=1 Tax=Caenorhabditis elegans TaxID=6239 RepID=O44132_CAEEL|nr:Transmembrane 9 superfamily member [Caenorhabditis elegans]CCD61157.1 Transmembrane 9 superfamily member [Caenorhabditis elegans]|eukprot:NP_500727.1 Uncharacterized protein CELE_C24D10.5 [Caenorhabditis elegans]
MDQIHKYPAYTQYFNIPATILAAILCYQYDVYDLSIDEHRYSIIAIIVSILISGSLIAITKSYRWGNDSEYESGHLGNFKQNYRIGSYGIAMFSFSGMSYFCSYQRYPISALFSFFVFNATSAMIYFVFVWELQPLCRGMKYKKGWKDALVLCSPVLGALVISFIISICIVHFCEMRKVWFAALYYVPQMFLNHQTCSTVQNGEIELVQMKEKCSPMKAIGNQSA